MWVGETLYVYEHETILPVIFVSAKTANTTVNSTYSDQHHITMKKDWDTISFAYSYNVVRFSF